MLSAGRPAADVTAPTPTLSRLHAAGAPSARGLLLTLLGVFVLPGDGTAWTSAVIAAFTRLGVEEKATRQALMRTAAARRRIATASASRPAFIASPTKSSQVALRRSRIR